MNQDEENAIKAAQTADLLCRDLQDMVFSKNRLLSRIALEMLGNVAGMRARILGIASDLSDQNA